MRGTRAKQLRKLFVPKWEKVHELRNPEEIVKFKGFFKRVKRSYSSHEINKKGKPCK